MVSAPIPKEIREYKEKFVGGLNLRQLISTILALGICVPLYIYGRRVFHEELISWLVMIIAFPLGAIGFFKFNGMTAEQLFVAILRYTISPKKRICMTSVCLREWQEQTRTEDLIREGIMDAKGKVKRKAKKYLVSASYERSYLIESSIKDGTIGELDLKELDSQLITVKKLNGKGALEALRKKISFIYKKTG